MKYKTGMNGAKNVDIYVRTQNNVEANDTVNVFVIYLFNTYYNILHIWTLALA